MPAGVVWGCFVTLLPLLALSIAVEGPVLMIAYLSSIQPSGVADLAYIIFVSTRVGFTLWISLLPRYSTATVTPFALLVAIVGLFSSAPVL